MSSHGRDGTATTTTVSPAPADLVHIGGFGTLAGTTSTFTSANSAVEHQTSRQLQRQASAATLISGSFRMLYYGQPQRYGSNAEGRSPHHQQQQQQQRANMAAAMLDAAATSNDSQSTVPGSDSSNFMSTAAGNAASGKTRFVSR